MEVKVAVLTVSDATF